VSGGAAHPARTPCVRADASSAIHGCPGRVLRLTLLAPDLVEAILDGRQTRGLTAQELLRGVPVGWGVQREAPISKLPSTA
jgi:hypothetical protein